MAYFNTEAFFTDTLFKCRIIELVQFTKNLSKFSFFNLLVFEKSIPLVTDALGSYNTKSLLN